MSNIRNRFISCTTQQDGSIDITVPASASVEFKQLIRRATNTWPDQSFEIRDFSDRLFGQADIMGFNMKEELRNIIESDIVKVVKPTEKEISEGYYNYFGIYPTDK